MKFIIFVCRTCEYRNRQESGMPNFESLRTEFESLSDAWQHLKETTSDPDDSNHDVIAQLQDEAENQ